MINSELAHELVNKYRGEVIQPSDMVELLVVYKHRLEIETGTCKWDISDSKGEYMFGCGNSYITPTNAVKRYKVCPYCGKPIELDDKVEEK